MKNKKGFSMVELLFVMAVMAALAAIAIPQMQASANAAELTSLKSDMLNAIQAKGNAAIQADNY